MKKYVIVILSSIFLIALCSSCLIIPTISETHLVDDIREKTFSITAGAEAPLGEPTLVLPDVLFEYLSYSPTDWFEFGLAGHYGIGLSGVDFKIDFVNMWDDESPWSAMLIGGALVPPGGGGGFVAHAGAAVNYQVNNWLELYGCAATSTLFLVPVFHVGVSVSPFRWLSLAGNIKVVLNTVDTSGDNPPAALFFSIAPSFNFGPKPEKE
ncbi:MAG: hypothetical protein HN368_10000 [Spirochaetales bacterium]|jgi:hypothetical protein|nr:hypothetical protein [Spirochaetales bacterium]